MLNRNKCICLVLICCLVVVSLCGCAPKTEPQISIVLPENDQRDYVEYEVTTGTFEKEIATAGMLYFLNSTEIVLEDVGGVLAEDIVVKRDQLVKEGDVLAVFKLPYNESDLKIKRLEYTQANSEYQSQISLYNSQIEAKRAQIASLSGVDAEIAKLELENIQIDRDQYDAKQKDKLSKLLETIETMESYAEPLVLRAPMSGLIHSVPKSTRAGTEFSAGQVIFKMYELSVENALIRCDKMEYQSFIYGMKTTIFSTSIDFTSTGTVVASPHCLTEENVDNDFVYIKIDDQKALENAVNYYIAENKKPTDPLAVRGVAIRIENVTMLSSKAIHFDTEKPANSYESAKGWVYVMNENGSVSRRDVLVGPSDGNITCILSGLSAGEKVIKY